MLIDPSNLMDLFISTKGRVEKGFLKELGLEFRLLKYLLLCSQLKQ